MQTTDYRGIIRDAVRASGAADPYSYAVSAIRELGLQSMAEAVNGCRDCKMNKDGKCMKSALYAKNPDEVNILVITDYPVDPIDGRPLSESEKDLLVQAYDSFEVDKNQIAYMNAVSCKPMQDIGSGKAIHRMPTSEEANNCKVFTDYAIKVLQPKLVILMGNFALNAYAHDVNIKSRRGKWMEVNGVPAMPTYSPLQIAKYINMDECSDLQEEMKDAFADDLYNAFLWFQEKYPEADFAPALRNE